MEDPPLSPPPEVDSQPKHEGAEGGAAEPPAPEGKEAVKITTRYPNGDHFAGEMVRGQRHGIGTYTWSGGNMYSGDWRHGVMEGKGSFSESNGDVYRGDFKEGAAHGQGVKRFACGNVYEGQWRNGASHGFGKMRFLGGDVHQGGYRDNERSGYGEYQWCTGDRMMGVWKGGRLQGPAQQLLGDGTHIVTSFEKDRMNGDSWIQFPDGSSFTGKYHCGRRCGYGGYAWNGGDRYEGEWAGGVPHGMGRLERTGDITYYGEFSCGTYHGVGAWVDGSHGIGYEGEWVKGTWEGTGVLEWSMAEPIQGTVAVNSKALRLHSEESGSRGGWGPERREKPPLSLATAQRYLLQLQASKGKTPHEDRFRWRISALPSECKEEGEELAVDGQGNAGSGEEKKESTEESVMCRLLAPLFTLKSNFVQGMPSGDGTLDIEGYLQPPAQETGPIRCTIAIPIIAPAALQPATKGKTPHNSATPSSFSPSVRGDPRQQRQRNSSFDDREGGAGGTKRNKKSKKRRSRCFSVGSEPHRTAGAMLPQEPLNEEDGRTPQPCERISVVERTLPLPPFLSLTTPLQLF